MAERNAAVVDHSGLVDGVSGASLIGLGEPFMDPQIFERIEFCHQHSISSLLSTNGTFLDERIAARVLDSPLGRALSNGRVGDEISLRLPAATRKLRILELITVHQTEGNGAYGRD